MELSAKMSLAYPMLSMANYQDPNQQITMTVYNMSDYRYLSIQLAQKKTCSIYSCFLEASKAAISSLDGFVI